MIQEVLMSYRQKDERHEKIRKLIMQVATKNYGIKEYDRENLLRLMNTIDELYKSNYKYDEIEEGLSLACESNPKFMPKLQEIIVSTKNVLKYMRTKNEDNSSDKEYEEAAKQTARRNKQRDWVEANFTDKEIAKAIKLWRAMEKIEKDFYGSQGIIEMLFFSDIAKKGSYARNLLEEMLQDKKNENTKRESKGKKTATVGEKKTD